MDIPTYKYEARRTMAELSTFETDTTHMIFGMLTEVGELADAFKKNLAYKKPLDYVNIEEEVGDLMWYVINFCSVMGFNLEDILEQNIAKLRARYPEKFTEDKAINRNLIKEREILEASKQ